MVMLCNRVRRFRFEYGDCTQEELAKAVGVSRQTIHALEKGNYVPSALLALKICRFFNESFERVFYLTTNESL